MAPMPAPMSDEATACRGIGQWQVLLSLWLEEQAKQRGAEETSLSSFGIAGWILGSLPGKVARQNTEFPDTFGFQTNTE